MQYISEKNRKNNLDELERRHGKLDKILNEDGRVLGYVVRAEIDDEMYNKDEDGKVSVIFNISFNFTYNVGDVCVNDDSEYYANWYSQSDLKHFAIGALLKSKINSSSKYYVTTVDQDDNDFSDYKAFKIGMMKIIEEKIENLHKLRSDCETVYFKNGWKRYWVSMGDDENVAHYIFRCMENVLKYYSNKKITIFIK